jgi:hypothetical protein
VKLHQENHKLKAVLRPRNDPTVGPVERLKSDYHNRTETMDDDLAFIQEVMAGASTAIPEFNAEMVLCRFLSVHCRCLRAHRVHALEDLTLLPLLLGRCWQ